MRRNVPPASVGLVVGLVVLAPMGFAAGCGGEEDCSAENEAADLFVEEPSNLTCRSDEDCRVVSTGCSNTARGFCGQVALNATAAASAPWRRIQDDLLQCQSDGCVQCIGALVPSCSQGYCGGAP